MKVDAKIKKIVERSEADSWVGYLTDSDRNFRIDVASILPYKGNREGSSKPPKWQMIRDYLLSEYSNQVTLVSGIEADDQLAIDQYKSYDLAVRALADTGCTPNEFKICVDDCYDHTIICSIDKDLMMVPGWHYDWNKDKRVFVTKVAGLRWFYKQLLTGDTVDNIKGLHGVGPKSTLLKYLDDCDEEWMMAAHVYGEYFKRFGHYASLFMRENASLLWMLRSEGDVFDYSHLLDTQAEARAPATNDWPAHVDWSQFNPNKEEENEIPF
jgi:hypothetical protein